MIFSHAQRKLSPSHKSYLFSTYDATLAKESTCRSNAPKQKSSSINICTGSHGRARSSISSRHIVCLAASKDARWVKMASTCPPTIETRTSLTMARGHTSTRCSNGACAYIRRSRVRRYTHFDTLKKHSNCCKKIRRRI